MANQQNQGSNPGQNADQNPDKNQKQNPNQADQSDQNRNRQGQNVNPQPIRTSRARAGSRTIRTARVPDFHL